MFLTLISAALAADPWLVDARPGRAFVPASLLVAKPTLQVQVSGQDATQVEIRHGGGPPCQVNSAVVDLAAYCAKLFSTPVTEGEWTVSANPGGLPVAIRLEESYATYRLSGNNLSFPGNPGYVLALFDDHGSRVWLSDPGPKAAGSGFEAQRINDANTAAGVSLVGVWSFNGTQALTWQGGAAATPVPEPPTRTPSTTPSCPSAERGTLVICYWVGAREPLYMSSSNGIIPANTPIDVWVFGAPEGAEVNASGAAGLSAGKVDTNKSIDGVVYSGSLEEAQTLRRHFNPRLPGEVVVELDDGKRKVRIAELYVVDPVIAALRMGIGLSTVVDADYVAITAPGSATPEIALASSDRFAPELVLGFAPFLFDRDGRIYAPGYTHRRVAPYVGLGIVSVAPDDSPALTPLKSVYLGAEYELVRSSSLTLAFVMRRVSRLPEPYSVGSPFVGAAVPTLNTYQPGVALVFNVSPELFQVSQNPFSFLGNL